MFSRYYLQHCHCPVYMYNSATQIYYLNVIINVYCYDHSLLCVRNSESFKTIYITRCDSIEGYI